MRTMRFSPPGPSSHCALTGMSEPDLGSLLFQESIKAASADGLSFWPMASLVETSASPLTHWISHSSHETAALRSTGPDWAFGATEIGTTRTTSSWYP